MSSTPSPDTMTKEERIRQDLIKMHLISKDGQPFDDDLDTLDDSAEDDTETAKDAVENRPRKELYITPVWWDFLDQFMRKGLPVCLTGPAGTGKTHAIHRWASRHKRNLYVQQGHSELTPEELRGTRSLIESETKTNVVTGFDYGTLAQSLRDPNGMYLFDELNGASNGVVLLLHNLLDDHASLTIPETGEVLKRHKNWRFAGTINPGYLGTTELAEGLISRCTLIECPPMPEDVERRILKNDFPLATVEVLDQALAAALAVRNGRQNGDHGFDMCLRTLRQIMFYWSEVDGASGSLEKAFHAVVLPKLGDPGMKVRDGVAEAVKTIFNTDAGTEEVLR